MLSVILIKMKVKINLMRCRVADDSVVVSKPFPVKAGNSLEDKIKVTLCIVIKRYEKCQKRSYLRRDEVYLKITCGLEIIIDLTQSN